MLFSGTLRINLDPFNIYTDDQLWNALEKVNLRGTVEGFEKKLEHECSESGDNLRYI